MIVDIYDLLMYAVYVIVGVGVIFYAVRKVFQWSDNNHAAVTEHTVEVVDKQTETKSGGYHPYRTGYKGEIVYYLTLKTEDGKKNRYMVSIVDFDKATVGAKGVLRLKGTRFFSFEKEDTV